MVDTKQQGRLTRRGRAARLCISAIVAAALVAGTLWGQDDHFPFGPFRMYSTTTTDEVVVHRFEATTADGRRIDLRSRDFGLRPAEVNGQIAAFADDRDLLRTLAQAYQRFHPEGPELVALRLVRGTHHLEAGRPVAYGESTVATWRS